MSITKVFLAHCHAHLLAYWLWLLSDCKLRGTSKPFRLDTEQALWDFPYQSFARTHVWSSLSVPLWVELQAMPAGRLINYRGPFVFWQLRKCHQVLLPTCSTEGTIIRGGRVNSDCYHQKLLLSPISYNRIILLWSDE